MASIREISPVLWRRKLREASFKAAPFHVEQQGRMSGRRLVIHTYPKLDRVYSEDMGMEPRRYSITGYVVQKVSANMLPRGSNFSMNYDESRDLLIEALESGGPGTLVDPYNNKVGPMLFACERYTCTESRERGGYAQFDMQFVEADTLSSGFPGLDTATQVEQAANNSTDAAAAQLDAQQANTSNLPAWWLTTVGR